MPEVPVSSLATFSHFGQRQVLETTELISRLKDINEEYGTCISAGNLRGIHEKNDKFHEIFFSACGNPYLCGLVSEYMDVAGFTFQVRLLGFLRKPRRVFCSRGIFVAFD